MCCKEDSSKLPYSQSITGPVRIVLIVMVLLTFCLAFQGSRGIWERDEGRYTNIALRMLQKGDYVVPALNDDVPHFAKPPLTYWAIAGGMWLLGWNEWGARLPNALAFFATILVVFALAKRITPSRRWLPPLIYASFLFPYSGANIITADTLLALWEALAVLGFVEWWHKCEKPGRSPFLLLMWGGFGLAFLTKGPPGLLPLLAIVMFILLAKGWKAIFQLFPISGIMIFILIGLGWYVLAASTHPGIMTYFIRDEFVNRIASDMHQRNPEWYKPFVIYIPILLLGTLPWTLPLLRACRSIPRTLFSRLWWQDKLDSDQWVILLILWVLLPLAVFFASRSRLPLYILPIFVPLALITGKLTRFEHKRKVTVYLLVLWVLILIALKFVASFYPCAMDSRAMARVIQNKVHPIPHEVVFIDTEPFWGLNLYLHSEMERVSLTATTNMTSLEESLSTELLEREPGTLFIVDKRKAERVITTFHKMGVDVRSFDGYGSWILITPTKPGKSLRIDTDPLSGEAGTP
jgi:4-amino-4-deoxy-L-arabinose transferase-like glycosyltransferase